MSKFWSQRVHELDPYIPGEQPKDTQYIKLNTNENPYPPSPHALAAMRNEVMDSLRLYPDPNADELKQAIADYYQLERQQVFVGNGSDEVLAHTFAALLKHDNPLLYPEVSYSFYPVYSKLFGINDQTIPLTEQFEVNPQDYHINNGGIIFPNPNAPTGIALTLLQIEDILQNNQDSVVVVDEAYVDFGAETAIKLVAQYPNLLVIQTFSKSRSLAGIRVGFAVGSVELIEALERVKNSFNSYPLGREDIAAAVASINDREYFAETCNKIIHTRTWVSEALQNAGFDVLPSQANFIFARPPEGNAAEMYQALKDNGVLVRYFSTPNINEYLRITIGTDQEMQTLLQTVSAIMG